MVIPQRACLHLSLPAAARLELLQRLKSLPSVENSSSRLSIASTSKCIYSKFYFTAAVGCADHQVGMTKKNKVSI